MRYMNYKPGWWFAYFIYCLIPITIYIAFLLSRRGMDNDEIEVVKILKHFKDLN